MSNEQIKVTVENGVSELVIRNGEAAPIPVYHGYGIDGLSIEAVKEYLAKSKATDEEIKNSFVLFSYEDLFLKMQFNDRMRVGEQIREGDRIDGGLKLHPDLTSWGINKGKKYTNLELADFIKMHRHYFENKDVAMKLVSELRALKIKTEREAENSDNKQGDYRIMASQRVIESNIPASFILKLPVFVGTEPISVAVEVEISAHDFGCSLISPDLKEYIDQEAKVIIDEQLAAIRELYPDLRIFQK